MSEKIASGIYVVRVTRINNAGGGALPFQLWAAAVPREEAVKEVMRQINNTEWTAELTDKSLTTEQVRTLNMKPGSVREITSL